MQNKEVLGLIKLEALSLGVEEQTRIRCPFCQQGSEKDFTIFRTHVGVYYQCWHASCGEKGFIPSLGYKNLKETKLEKDHTYKSELLPLTLEIIKFLFLKYNLSFTDIKNNGFKLNEENTRLFMSVMNEHGFEFGFVAKKLNPKTNGPKTINYFNERYAIHYPHRTSNYLVTASKPLVVVEDILSSIRVSKFLPCVSILGSNLTTNHVIQLMKRTDHIILMLDLDTWQLKNPKPIKFKKEFGLCFKHFDLVQVPKDPKDCSDEELQEVLKQYV